METPFFIFCMYKRAEIDNKISSKKGGGYSPILLVECTER